MIARPDLEQCIQKMNKLFFATVTGDENNHTPIAEKLFATIPPHQGNMIGYAEQMSAVLDNVLLTMMLSPDYDKEFKMDWWNRVRGGQDKIRECGRTYTLTLLADSLNEVKGNASSLAADYDAIAKANAELNGRMAKMTTEHQQLVKQYEAYKAQVNAELQKVTGASYRQKMF